MWNTFGRRQLPDLSREELSRYSRHIILPEVGETGQRKLKAARILCVGTGGLGSPVSMYLAAAGVGTLGLVDFDVVEFHNLQRQIVHGTPDVGKPKLQSARARLDAINPGVKLDLHDGPLNAGNALRILGEYDVVVDGTDNFPARYLINDACVMLGRPEVYGAIFRFDGQASVFATPVGPCYRCVYPEPPPPGLVPSCAEAGVFGALPGVIGTIQATEAIKLVLGVGETLAGRLLIYDALRLHFRELRVKRNPACPVCGDTPSIRELIDYEAFCGMSAAEPLPAEVAPGELPMEITVEELKTRIDGGERLTLVDVREHYEHRIVHLPGATLIPMGELIARQQELNPDDELIIYCHFGIRSLKAAAYLRHEGFEKARSLRGGIDDWSRRVDRSMPTY
ncbi:MAG: molybdopterin-synthase adenylyltransferase MoeB [Acidobacteriota bacterium]